MSGRDFSAPVTDDPKAANELDDLPEGEGSVDPASGWQDVSGLPVEVTDTNQVTVAPEAVGAAAAPEPVPAGEDTSAGLMDVSIHPTDPESSSPALVLEIEKRDVISDSPDPSTPTPPESTPSSTGSPSSLPTPSPEPTAPEVTESSTGTPSPDPTGTAPTASPTAAGPSEPSSPDPDATTGGDAVRMRLSYADFRNAYAGDWGSRLQVTAYPACMLTTPNVEGCDQGVPVVSQNDPATQTLTFVTADPDAALVPPPDVAPAAGTGTGAGNEPAAFTATSGSGTVYAVSASVSGDSGDYGANPLSSAASWQVGDGSGEFSYSYPFSLPAPAVAGPTPSLSLSYSSGAVDGMTRTTNGQTSQAGIGWDLNPGYITRSYIPCAKDGNANMHDKGDLCWKSDADPDGSPHEIEELSIVLNGHSSRLVQEAHTNTFRLQDDPGWQVVRYRTAPADVTANLPNNSDTDNEAFRVRTPDGTTYWFGWGRNPSGTDDGSTLTVPVYGNDPGEPCYNPSSLQGSFCKQAWRWGLDRVVDRHGNLIRYEYAREVNYYSRYALLSTHQDYDRAGYLTRITYGTPASAMSNFSQVSVTVDERCIESVSTSAACPGGPRSNPDSWPDVPGDLICAAADDCLNGSPSFFSMRRYATIATSRYKNAVAMPVDTFTLVHRFPQQPSGTVGPRDLWLYGILRVAKGSGTTGADITLPYVLFEGTFLKNRVVTPSGGAEFYKQRVSSIRNESGGRVDITYGHDPGHACDATYAASTPKASSIRECFTQRYNAGWEWWHKYVVLRTVTNDDALGYRVGTTTSANYLGLAQVLDYEYLGDAGWRYSSATAVVPADDKTWDDWRGYESVIVHTRSVSYAEQVLSSDLSARKVIRFRGLNGNRLNASGGTRSETVTTSEGNTFTDLVGLEGRVAEESVLDASGSQMSRTNFGYAIVDTASRDPYLPAHFTYTARVTTLPRAGAAKRTVNYTVDDGGSTHRGTMLGAVTQVDDDQATPSDQTDDVLTCTDWAVSPDNATNLSDAPVRGTTTSTQKVGSCSSTGTLSSHVNYYDGSLTAGTIPSKGDVTQTADAATSQQSVWRHFGFDSYGRPTQVSTPSYNQNDPTWTVTVYNPGSDPNSMLVSTRTTGPAVATVPTGLVTSSTFDPRRGQTETLVDPNNQTTTIARDALGRPVWVDKPGSDPKLHSITYAYTMSPTTAGVVATTVTQGSKLDTSWEYFDGWGRSIESRVLGENGGYVSSYTGYEPRGSVWLSVPAVAYSSTTSTAAWTKPNLPAIEHYAYSAFDPLGRAIYTADMSKGVENHTTRYAYESAADIVSVTPPGTTTAAKSKTRTELDALGRPNKVVQYADPATGTGDNGVANYTYWPSGQLKTISTPIGTDTTPVTYSYEYDQLGRRTKADDPDTGTTLYAYDAAGNATRVDDDTSNPPILTSYDALGRPTLRKEENGDELARWTYDSVTNGIGLLTSTTSVTQLGEFTSSVGSYTVAGQPASVTETYPSNLTGEGTGSKTLAFTYDELGQVKSTTYPAVGGLGALTVTRRNGRYGKFLALTTDESTTHTVGRVWYDTLDRPLYLASADEPIPDNGSTTDQDRLSRYYSWAQSGRLTGLDAITGTSAAGSQWTQLAYDYDYDILGNPVRVTGTRKEVNGGADTKASWCYGYDGVSRLTSATTGVPDTGTTCGTGTDAVVKPLTGEQYALTFGYAQARMSTITSSAGTATYGYPSGAPRPHAPTSITRSGSGAGLPPAGTLVYDSIGRATTWTPSGGSVTTYAYDSQGNLATVDDAATGTGADITNAYDASGIRIARKTPTETVLYVAGTEITKPSNGSLRARRNFTTPGGTPLAVQESNGASMTWTWLFADVQGSVRMTKDAATGAVQHHAYYPFGDLITPVGNLPGEHGFLGKTHDPDGTVRLDHRSYDQGLATLTSPDSLLDPMDPQNLNAYAYSRNNPIATSDPSGLQTHPDQQPPPCTTAQVCDPGEDVNGSEGWEPGWGSGQQWDGSDTGDGADTPAPEGPAVWCDTSGRRCGTVAGFGQQPEQKRQDFGGVMFEAALAGCSWVPLLGVGCDAYDMARTIGQDGVLSWGAAASAAGFVPFGDVFKLPRQFDNISDATKAAHAAAEAAAGAERATAVIGRQADTAVAKDWAGHEVLSLPAKEWSIAKNDQWVQSVIDRKMPVYVGSPTTWPNLWDAAAGRSTVFGRELQQFTRAGYTWDGWTMVPPGG